MSKSLTALFYVYFSIVGGTSVPRNKLGHRSYQALIRDHRNRHIANMKWSSYYINWSWATMGNYHCNHYSLCAGTLTYGSLGAGHRRYIDSSALCYLRKCISVYLFDNPPFYPDNMTPFGKVILLCHWSSRLWHHGLHPPTAN